MRGRADDDEALIAEAVVESFAIPTDIIMVVSDKTSVVIMVTV